MNLAAGEIIVTENIGACLESGRTLVCTLV
jgi:hypothetical protein